MSARIPLYQDVLQRLIHTVGPQLVPRTALVRLALLVTGLLAAKTTVMAQIAAELLELHLTAATQPDSIARRLRRTLGDARLTAATCYIPVLHQVLEWDTVLRGSRRVVLIIDESSKADDIHRLRVSLPYWGGSLPLAWAVWEQNVALPDGYYWQAVDRVLAQVAAVLPSGLQVVVVADRAYAIPPFIDRLHAYDWHWVLRLTTTGSHRFRDQRGREQALREVVQRQVGHPGQRWRTRGHLFKDAGWRDVGVVGLWGLGAKEPLVVITDLPPQWPVLRLYERRFWIEAGFRSDKRKGWQWEASQVQGVAHHERLVLAMAWASVVVLCVGVEEAQARLAGLAARRVGRTGTGHPRHARESVFTLGLRAVRRWLYHTTPRAMPWRLPDLEARSWERCWHQAQALRCLFPPVRP